MLIKAIITDVKECSYVSNFGHPPPQKKLHVNSFAVQMALGAGLLPNLIQDEVVYFKPF